MSRRVITTQLQARDGGEFDTYFDKVVKYVPADIVSAWVAAKGVIESAAVGSKQLVLWICLAIGLVMAFVWTLKQTAQQGKPPAIRQAVVATGAFLVWTIALGEPFASLLGRAQQSLSGALLLIFYTLAVGLISPKE